MAKHLQVDHVFATLEIFEHDYHYYKLLDPNIKYVTVDNLSSNKPLLLALPFPGHLDKHRDIKKIIDILETYKNVFGTYGIHPHEANKYKDITIENISNQLLKNKKTPILVVKKITFT